MHLNCFYAIISLGKTTNITTKADSLNLLFTSLIQLSSHEITSKHLQRCLLFPMLLTYFPPLES